MPRGPCVLDPDSVHSVMVPKVVIRPTPSVLLGGAEGGGPGGLGAVVVSVNHRLVPSEQMS